jgi:ClpP class serine protease
MKASTSRSSSAGKYKAEDAPFGPLTDEARAAIQGQVDSYYGMFVRDVAKGRGVALDVVRDGFGEGRVVNAKDALASGMVDRVATMADVLGGLMTKSPAMSVSFDLGTAATASVESPKSAVNAEEIAEILAQTEPNERIHADVMIVREETPDERARRLRLRLLELS